jgi:predicted deacetylase
VYLIRLDDACSYYDVEKWQRIEALLDEYSIKPIVAIIPNCEDPLIRDKYVKDDSFWDKARSWQEKGWTIALHGYNHVYTNFNAKGMNPVNNYSEFVGISLETQKEKISKGLKIFRKQGIEADIFVAPAHSFDKNTLRALAEESDIRIISDTIARDIYWEDGFYFIPQQCGEFRRLPLHIITGCYHPNTMNDESFDRLEAFIKENHVTFGEVNEVVLNRRPLGLVDKMLRSIYFIKRNIKKQRAPKFC